MFKENKRILYVLIGLTFVFALLISGYAMRLSRDQKSQSKLKLEYEKIENEIKRENKKAELQTIVSDDNIVMISTNIRYKTKNNKCGHEIIKDEKAKEGMIGLNRSEFEDYVKVNLSNYKMNSYSKENIELLIEKDTLCSKHFIVGEKDGKLAIFAIDEQGERIIHKVFKDATIATIREENQKRLKEGIVVDSEEEAIQVLEDFIS